MARRPSSSDSRRQTSGGSSRRRGSGTRIGTPERQDDNDLFTWATAGLMSPALTPTLFTMEKLGLHGKTGANILSALGTSPLYTLADPQATIRNAQSAVTGLWEGPYGAYKSIKEIGGKDTAKLFWEGLKGDYQERYGDDWRSHARENGLFNMFDLLAVMGGAASGAALAGAAERLGTAAKPITLRSLWRESREPGLLSEGQVRARELSYQPPTGKAISAVQPYSRSPLRRGIQQSFTDGLAEQFGEVPIFGARSRVSRAQASQLRRVMERTLGGVVGEEALEGIGQAGRTRLYWEAQLGSADNETLQRLRKALTDEYEGKAGEVADPEFAQVLREAKQLGLGGEMIKRLDAAIEYVPGKRYERARDAMRQMTVLSERSIEDANGFTSLKTDLKRVEDRLDGLDPGSDEHNAALGVRDGLREELSAKSAQLQEMFDSRRGIVRDYLDTKGVDSEERSAWLERLTAMFGAEQAAAGMRWADGLANQMRPDDPASFWSDSVGMPSDEKAAAFMARVGDNALYQHGMRSLIEGDAANPSPSTRFYSPLQRALDAMGKKPMQAGQMQAQLRRAIGDEEMHNSGLDMHFDALDQHQMVRPDELKTLLANRLNAYNLREVHLTNTREAEEAGLPALYEREQQGTYVARDPADGEYHEVFFELPGENPNAPDYEGTGKSHWYRKNVAVHFRFHVFDEDGKRKLLIEEIQSDWVGDFRKRLQAEREGTTVVSATSRPPLGRGTAERSSYINSPVRWLLRHAAENDVDEVILVSRETQLVRNSRVFTSETEWAGYKHLTTEQMARRVREHSADSRSYIGYEEDIPKIIARESGVEGVRVEDAYQGHFRSPHDFQDQVDGPMAGVVFRMTDEARANAMKPKAMYQRPPDWKALPKGAVELLADGGRRVHLFDSGDISTWIHELGHVAIYDLSPKDRGILGAHFGGGKLVDDWTEMEHESFARAFEQYVRDGTVPNRELQSVFAKLSAWIRTIWEREKRDNPELPEAVNEVFGRMFRREGEPDIFVPHRATAPDLGGGRTSRGIPRANREIGDRTFSRIPLFKKNTLGLLKAGLLNDDPRVLFEHTNRVVALARANQLREAVLEMGEPLLPGDYPNFATQYVVKRAGRGVDKPTFDALEAADNPDEVRATIRDYVDDHITGEQAKYEEWRGDSQLYVVDKKVVDMLFKQVTGKIPGAATKPSTNSAKVLDAGLDSIRGLLLYANPGFYVSNLLGNTGMMMLSDPRAARYLPWSMKQAISAAARPDAAGRLWQRISVEMGRGPTSGTFSPQKPILSGQPGSEGNLAGRAGEALSSGLGEYGRRSGRVIDDTFRVSAWRQAAAKRGYKTDEQVTALLEDVSVERPFQGKTTQAESKAERDLNAIRDEAEQLMLDFDSMSPFERTYLQRAIFLYPFLKASTKYPVMYAGERPITSGVLAELGHQGDIFGREVLGERPELPEWLSGYARGPGGYMNVGAFSPFNLPPELLNSLINLRGPAPVGVQRPWDYANPLYQLLFNMARQQNEYGRDVPVEQIPANEFPMPAWMRQAILRKQPSEQFGERDFLNTLLRSIRAVPVELSAGMGEGPSAPEGTTRRSRRRSSR